MRRLSLGVALVVCLSSLSPLRAGDETGMVTLVEDATSIKVRVGDTDEAVRLIGLAAPLESTFLTRSLVLGQRVTLKSDPGVDDRPGGAAHPRYVYLEDGLFVNAELIRLGYAHAAETPCSRREEFQALEREAAARPAGLWT